MRFARALVIVSYGLFTIGAQTLLFREFITAFEGNDISVGVFFGSWFLWVGLGAVLVRRWSRLADVLLHHIELLFLAYLPALFVQLVLIVQVRELAGIAPYDLMSIQTLLSWALLVNAPVSLVTGLLFPLACRWIEQGRSVPVSHVYILEAVGSFTGGIGVTILLAFHVETVRVLFLLAIVLSGSVLPAVVTGLLVRRRSPATRGRAYPAVALVVALLSVLLPVMGLAGRVDARVAQRLTRLKWARLLADATYRGTLRTAQAEYLYGEYRNQWIVLREGVVCESLPNEAAAGQTAATALCQKPDANRVLVVGSGLALCMRLLSLPQIEQVAWAHADSEYVARLPAYLPPGLRIDDERFEPVTQELRGYLRGRERHFDLVILDLPDVSSSAFNRYFTSACYEQINTALAPGGTLAVSVAGGENVIGTELAALGASVKRTLEAVFAHLVLVPGDETWFLASDSDTLTGDPATLRDRFAAIEGAETLFPAAGLLSIYLPDRATQALESYAKVELPADLLINRDEHPLTHLYSLLLAARQSGVSATRLVTLLALGGWPPLIVPILVLVVLRLWSALKDRSGQSGSSFDSSFLVFSTGFVGIAVVIVLMYLYETRFGSLYLHIGLISSLFMVGLTAGAILVRWRIARAGGTRRDENVVLPKLLIGLALLHGLVLAGIALGFCGRSPITAVSGQTGLGVFAAVFILSGLCCGGYWPVAAAQLSVAGRDPGEAGSQLETADHLGACVGGWAASLLMVPVLGIRTTLLVLIGLVLANLPAAVMALRRGRAVAPMRTDQPWLGKAGYILFGVGACVVLCSNMLTVASLRLQPAVPEYAVRALAGEQQAQETLAVLPDDGRQARYFTLSDANGLPAGFIFGSADLAPGVRGFGGRINLAIHVDRDGVLRDLMIVRSNETPSYLELVRGWLGALKGRGLFTPDPFAGVDSVTGATVSSEAILAALRESGHRFAGQVLARDVAPAPGRERAERAVTWRRYLPDAAGLYLLAAFAAAVAVTLRGGFRSRFAVLVLTFVVGGLALNAQYSSEQIVTLLSLERPGARLSGAFALVIGVPLLVVLFGNLYCGYVCPFGAAQELLGSILPRRYRPVESAAQVRVGRFVRYALLFVLIAVFFLSRNRTTLSGDPLIWVFALRPSLTGPSAGDGIGQAWIFAVAAMIGVGSLFVVRFWCRYLCPVGAFLSLLNHFVLLRRWLPAKWFGRCEFALTARDRLECLHCDRCRYPGKGVGQAPCVVEPRRAEATAYPLIAAAVLIAVLIGGVSVSRFRQTMPAFMEQAVGEAGGAGQPRDVDVRRIRTLIEQGRLSGMEAQYYKKLDDHPDSEVPDRRD